MMLGNSQSLSLEPYQAEAESLITSMLRLDPKQRPSANEVLAHPMFWTPLQKLSFLADASDRFEILPRDKQHVDEVLLTLEENSQAIVGKSWLLSLDKLFLQNLGKFRKYDGHSLQDLLRAMRNKVSLILEV